MIENIPVGSTPFLGWEVNHMVRNYQRKQPKNCQLGNPSPLLPPVYSSILRRACLKYIEVLWSKPGFWHSRLSAEANQPPTLDAMKKQSMLIYGKKSTGGTGRWHRQCVPPIIPTGFFLTWIKSCSSLKVFIVLLKETPPEKFSGIHIFGLHKNLQRPPTYS